MGRSRQSHPDYTVDVDHRSETPESKRAGFVDSEEYQRRAEDRAGARELDQAVESMPGLSRSGADRERAMPRDTAADLGHPRMERQLPGQGDVRRPLSSRQRKARHVAKREAQRRMPDAQHRALQLICTDEGQWRQANDALAENTGDAQQLDEGQRRQVQRVDRAIQRYERLNDRGHVVYANVVMPKMINAGNVEGFVRNNFEPGTEIAFDRYTGGAHTLHELESTGEEAPRTVALEIQTRRGMYLGRSDSVDDTGHLLPRGMRLNVAGSHWADYQRPDGSQGRKLVVQLVDTTSSEDAPTGPSSASSRNARRQ